MVAKRKYNLLISSPISGYPARAFMLTKIRSTNNFTAHLADGSSELYDPSGNLLQIITRAGLVTTLARDSSGG
jgi:hypothetical protein